MPTQPLYWKVLTRRKILSSDGIEEDSKLNRVLSVFDLTALGVGSTLGAGIYVLAGQIAKEQAGPAVILSFAIAAFASLLAGVCYAEFGARVPKAGSAYAYSYVCIGELAAFVIGWNLILEYVIGTASVCRGISLYLDTLLNDTLKNTFAEVAPMNVSFFGSYFDFLAFGLVIVFGISLAFGVEASTMLNNFCTCLNISVLLFVVIGGSFKINFANWQIDPATVNATSPDDAANYNLGTGGFFPFGLEGTLKGAATCFFGFVGFDCIATTGEEVRNPRKNIPRSILFSLLIIFLCYFGVSIVLTLMVPYYLQDPNAPLPYVFEVVGWNFAMWMVSIGGLIGLVASLCGALYPLPRIMYSMAEDGLLFKFLGKINLRFRTPVVGSICAALMTGLISGFFDLAQLVSLLSIGTLLAYIVVAISITILRYMDNLDKIDKENVNQILTEHSMLTSSGTRVSFKSVFTQLFNFNRITTPNALSTRIVGSLIVIFCVLSLGIGLIIMHGREALNSQDGWIILVLIILVFLTVLVLLAICLQPREMYTTIFRGPCVPIVPAVSIFINIYLMLQFDVMTWIRFGVWMAFGVPIFVACYCMNGKSNRNIRNQRRGSFLKAFKSSQAELLNNNNNKTEPAKMNGTTIYYGVDSTSPKSISSSLDEIISIEGLSNELKEMKNSNGNNFFIEDTNVNPVAGTANVVAGTFLSTQYHKDDQKLEATEDEESVIAMLDDVLQSEEENFEIPDYRRHLSIDSEFMPCFYQSTTIATIHSSSDSSENNLEDVEEAAETSSNSESQRTLDNSFDVYAECEKTASELIDNILTSEALWFVVRERLRKADAEPRAEGIENNHQFCSEEKVITIEAENKDDANTLKRSESILSTSSVNDPLHSEKFKSKLSKIIMRLPSAKLPMPGQSNQEFETAIVNPRELRHSKSEADIRNMVLRAIEDTQLNVNKNEENNKTSIPKAPKFDPILYKTLGNRGIHGCPKECPSFDKSATTKESVGTPAKEDTKSDITNGNTLVPFKTKLEAILRRGPSHRSQKRPDIILRRPKSMGILQSDISNDGLANTQLSENFIQVFESIRNRKRQTTKSETNLSILTDPAEAINKIRKSLRPVKMDLFS